MFLYRIKANAKIYAEMQKVIKSQDTLEDQGKRACSTRYQDLL